MPVLRDGSYDQRLMPFVPKYHTYYGNQLTMYNRNEQWLPLVASIAALWNVFSEILSDALKLAESTGLSLPSYALELVPRLRYNISSDDPPFVFQLLPFFSPTALRIRWCRIGRVIALLEGYINLCTRLLRPNADWARGKPVGIRVDSALVHDGDKRLAKAYRFLSTPFTLPLDLADDEGYSLENAQDALLGRGYGKTPARLVFEDIELLENTDVDALDFAAIRPNFNPMKYLPDGLRTTRKERDALAAMASDEDDDYSSEWVSVPIHIQPPPMTGETPSLDTTSEVVPPLVTEPRELRPIGALELNPGMSSSALAPVSASTSATASATTSPYSDSSANLPSPPVGPSPTDWRAPSSNRKRRAADFPRAAKPAKRRDAGTRDWSGYFEAQVGRGVEYTGQEVISSRPHAVVDARRPDPSHSSRDVIAAPRAALEAPRPLMGQEKQMLFRDSDTGAMAAMPVFETSFASLGVSFPSSAPKPEESQHGDNSISAKNTG
jgi:hypothetical protein